MSLIIRMWIVAFALTLSCTNLLHADTLRSSDSIQLVTPAEIKQDAERARKSPAKPTIKSIVVGAPLININAPGINETLKAPFPIRVSFIAQDGASIDVASFRAYYGMFKLDITERVTKKAKVTAQGIELEKAEIPSGKHQLTLQVADNRGRVGESAISFEVE